MHKKDFARFQSAIAESCESTPYPTLNVQIIINTRSLCLAVSSKGKSVMSLPVGITGATSDFVVQVTLPKTTVLPPCSSQPTELPVFVNGLAQPVYSRVSADDFVLGVNQDHFKEFVDGILPHPVGVQHTKPSAVTTSSLL